MLKRLRASYRYGNAVACFAKGQFTEVLRCLSDASALDKTLLDNVHYNSLMGRSYVALHRDAEAIAFLLRSRQLWRQGSPRSSGVLSREETRATLVALRDILRQVGNESEAIDVDHEIKDMKRNWGT